MKLPEVQNADKYTGMYVVDFGDHCGVGFTAEEVAELLEGERFADVQVYKVHRANPDGTMELKGVPQQTFQLETGMFFYAGNETTGRADFERLAAWADQQLPPARCKVQLANVAGSIVTALIYPAEYNDQFSQWLIDGDYRTSGQVQAGPSIVKYYHEIKPDILDRKQLWPSSSIEHLKGEALLEATNRAIVR